MFRFGDTEVDFARCEVRRGDEVVELSALEFKLLATFVRRRGRVLNRGQLLDAVWGHGVTLNDESSTTRLWGCAGNWSLSADPVFLLNICGMGYRFDA